MLWHIKRKINYNKRKQWLNVAGLGNLSISILYLSYNGTDDEKDRYIQICIKMIISNSKIPLIETSSIYFLRKKCCPISKIFPFHNIYDPFWVIDYLSSILIVLIHCKTYYKNKRMNKETVTVFRISIIFRVTSWIFPKIVDIFIRYQII